MRGKIYQYGSERKRKAFNESLHTASVPLFDLGWHALIILAGSLAAGFAYRGRDGGRYKILQPFHFRVGRSGHLAAGMDIQYRDDPRRHAFPPVDDRARAAAGLRLGVAGDGFWDGGSHLRDTGGGFSMERLTPHRRAAMTFFRSGLLTVLFYTIAIFTQSGEQRLIPLGLNIVGIISPCQLQRFSVHRALQNG